MGVIRDLHFGTSGSLTKASDCVDHSKLWKFRKETRIPDPGTCLLRSLCAGQKEQLENWTWNNRLVQNWERRTTRLYLVTLLL